jgi:hypothetical protein
VQTALVPLAVYQAALRPDLGDVRVFNAAGAAMPHAIRKLDDPERADEPREQREHRVSFYPLRAPVDAPATAIDQLALRIERGAGGSIIDIHSEAATDAGAAPATRVIAHVLDTQAIERDMLGLRIELEEPKDATLSYLATVAIDASDDLTAWRTIVPEGGLARLAHGGQIVRRDHIELPGVRAKFLRVRALGGAELPAPIGSAWVEIAPGEAPARARDRLRVSGKPGADPGIYDYDLGGAFPVDRVRIMLPTSSTLIQAELSVAAAQGETEPAPKVSAIRARTSKRIYDDVWGGPLYRLQQEGKELHSPPIDLSGRRIRYLSLLTGDGSALDAPPEIEVEYLPAQIIFVAREPGPFELAYGSHAAAPVKLTPDALLAPLGADARRRLLPSTVALGATRTISGSRALTAPPPPPPIKTYALWAVLIAGTLGITLLAIRLLRKLD